MKIVVHYPESENGKAELAKKVAEIHAQAIADYVSKLDLTGDEKISIIQNMTAKKE